MPPTQDPSHPVPMRVGVLVVAYNAATTLVQTLDRLPSGFRTRVDHILLADDASQDGTYELGIAYRDGSELPLTVVRHEKNLGYGGNQKAGYRWAIEHGLDVVVLLHGDGQYAPEVIDDIVGTDPARRRRRRVRLADDDPRWRARAAGCRCTSSSATGS